MMSAVATTTSAIARRCSACCEPLRSSAKRELNTAISWNPNNAWMPGRIMRHSSSSERAASASVSSWRSSYPRPAMPSVRRARAGNAPPDRVPERAVRCEEPGRLVAPFELVLDARAPESAHRRAALRVVAKLDDPGGEVIGIVAMRIEGRIARRKASLGEIELHDRLAERHRFQDAVHVRVVVQFVG